MRSVPNSGPRGTCRWYDKISATTLTETSIGSSNTTRLSGYLTVPVLQPAANLAADAGVESRQNSMRRLFISVHAIIKNHKNF
jgi:hypothetical protein